MIKLYMSAEGEANELGELLTAITAKFPQSAVRIEDESIVIEVYRPEPKPQTFPRGQVWPDTLHSTHTHGTMNL